ncbi:MAG TPA: beta-eliminating lyase-related protein [Mycobacteriales bacterium]|nr:beta-eliminating lyase-related protein [Mycobacteriales bacterium]
MDGTDVDRERESRARQGCRRWLSGAPGRTMREWLADLAADPVAAGFPDRYGQGEAIGVLEARVAGLLGKPAGVFVIKGVIAQQAALRVWTERAGRPSVALHPRCHLDHDEAGGYERLHGLRPVRLGDVAPFTATDLDGVTESLGAVTVELPLRRAGFRLTGWDDLVAISTWCRDRSVPFHLDGARLWESAPYYGRPLAEIAALADSVYVSFYKGLGGLAGCVLAGPEDFVAAVRPWIVRQGGSVYTAFPYVLAAERGLAANLPRMAKDHRRAVSLAGALAGLPGASVAPDPPHTNAFQLYLPADPIRLAAANLALAESESVWLFSSFTACPVPGLAMAEVQVGEATDAFTDPEVVTLVAHLLTAATR